MSTVSQFSERAATHQPGVHVIARPRVVALLDDVVQDHPLTIVIGGAGTGKSLAVTDWSEVGRPPGPVAWVSLNKGLRSPVRFWRALWDALRGAFGSEDLALVGFPRDVDDEFVDTFSAALVGRWCCLVLDNAQTLDGSEVWDGLELLVGRLPRGLRLVLVSRHDPPIAVHRLRVAGDLGEVRSDDLAFTTAEARRLLDDQSIHLSTAQLDRLMEATEGWAAGLRLAVMSLTASDDPVQTLESFSGRQDAVVGYIMDEVLRSLDPDTADLLRRTSICERMCGPLAEALTEDPEAAPQLVNLSRRNTFVTRSEDGEWFRYHPLLRDTLRAQLHTESPALEEELHRRAALWFEERGERLLALDHALATRDRDLVALVTLRSAAVCMFTSERGQLGTLIDRLPPEVTRDRADLQMVRALGAFCRADHTAEEALLEAVEAGLDALPEADRSLTTLNLEVLRAAAARRSGNAPAMTSAANRAVAVERVLTVEAAPGWAAFRGTINALAALGELWSGNPRYARTLMGRAQAQARSADIDDYGSIYYGGNYALAEHALGRIASSRAGAQEVTRRARLSGSDVRHESRFAHVALAAAEVQRGDAEAAGAAVDAGEVAAAQGDDPFIREGLRVVAATRCLLLDDLSGTRRQLDRIPPFAFTWPRMALVARQHAALEVEVELAAGAVTRAQEVLERFDLASGGVSGGPRPTEPDPVAIARARLLLARGLATQVREALDAQLGSEGVLGVEAWLAVAVADERLRREAGAVTALSRAIELAVGDEVRLPFLRRRDRLDALLERHLDLVGSHRAFVSSLLWARAGSDVPDFSPDLRIDPLTARELSVLTYLPSMNSNEEIGRALGISVNTVKQHLKAINRKLHVGTRRDAVRVARAAGLLPDAGSAPR